MSEYKRVVSYFYRYENGEKQNNVGYARLECRQDTMRLIIELHDDKCIENEDYVVYLYKMEGEGRGKLEIGTCRFQDKQLVFRCSSNEYDILGSKVPLDDCEGIMIFYNNQIFYGSQWTDTAINVDKLTEKLSYQKVIDKNVEKSAKTSNTKNSNVDNFTELYKKINEISENLEKSKEINSVNNNNVDKNEIKEKDVDNSYIIESSKEEKESNHEESEIIRQSLKETVDGRREETGKSQEKVKTKEETVESQEKIQVKKETEETIGIKYLLNHRSALPDFSNHEVMHCVRIVPEDIGYTNRNNWEYGNNSFVMHGYYNYQYLLLGQMQFADGKMQHIIGVPGIYSNKDKYLAGIFGFFEFIPLRSCPYKTGEFGYWIAKLVED